MTPRKLLLSGLQSTVRVPASLLPLLSVPHPPSNQYRSLVSVPHDYFSTTRVVLHEYLYHTRISVPRPRG
eukprot:1675871-Rhodomonas_salina.1